MEHIDRKKERMVFILSCLGLSLSQLLGQNCPSPDKEWIDAPGDLLCRILGASDIEQTKHTRLTQRFQEFLEYYDAVRHFGLNRDGTKHAKVDSLTFEKMSNFKDLAIEIWDTMIVIFKADPNNDLEDLESISEAVRFK